MCEQQGEATALRRGRPNPGALTGKDRVWLLHGPGEQGSQDLSRASCFPELGWEPGISLFTVLEAARALFVPTWLACQ